MLMQLLITTYHIDMYIVITIVPNNKIDLIVSLLTAAYSINCRLFFFTNVLLSVRIYR